MFKEEEQEENKDEPVITDDTATTSIDEITTIEENTEENDSTTNEKRLSQDSERSKDIGQRAHASFKSRRTSKIRRFRRQSDTSQRSFVRLVSQDKGGRGDHTPKTDPRLSSTREYESDEESMYSTRHEWAFDQIAMSEDSDSEFFDARGVCGRVCVYGWACGVCSVCGWGEHSTKTICVVHFSVRLFFPSLA